jgi:type IV secretory pathway TraG/TraD family ATPase VirD4
LAESYVAAAKEAKTIPGNGKSVPTHVRFLMDEFPNLGEIPEFKEKLATMRKYEISCTVICQTITQLKGMYEKDYEVVDANCPQKVFLGGDENSNNEYLSKKIGTGTVKGWNDSVDSKKVNMSYNVVSPLRTKSCSSMGKTLFMIKSTIIPNIKIINTPTIMPAT